MKSFSFGTTFQEANTLLALVLEGKKTATCSALSSYKNKSLPKKGEEYTVLDGCGNASCVIELSDVFIAKFCDIDEEFAFLEGEGDRSLSYWQKEHQRFFETEECFHPEMKLVCEVFKVIKRIA